MARVTIAPAGAPEAAPHAHRAAARVVAAASGAVAGAAIIVAVVVALLTAWWAGIVAAAVVGGGAWAWLVGPRWRSAEARALALAGPARPAAAPGEARVLNLVEGLAPGAGLARPELMVIDDEAPNALALGRDARRGVVVVTSGLLSALDRMQLEAVVAHLLVQVRDGVTAAATLSLAFRPSRAPAPVDMAQADTAAVALTRYPPALAAALEVVAAGGPAAPRHASPVLGPLWLVPPGDRAGAAGRVDALRGL
ncbi:MAG TPA: M48 family metalloprotease [Acidimicrobiales bacterium]|nr:M48 family metalloprotease [Acidimicrobiales bacterium]